MIDLGIYDEHNLAIQAFSSMLSAISDFRVVFTCNDRNLLITKLKNKRAHILILNLHDISVRNLNLIVQLRIVDPNIKILVVSANQDEEIVLKTFKAGVKGFLGKDATFNELAEAVYSLRNGHDYFNNTLTHILLNRYISRLDQPDQETGTGIELLSARQIEILRLWGESYSNQEIAEKLFISIRTVETHKNHIMQKLNLKNTVDMVKFAIKCNIIDV